MKRSPVLKFLAFLLCVLSAAAAFWGSVLSLMYWDDMWTEADYFSSDRYWAKQHDMDNWVESLLGLLVAQQERGLTYSEQERLSALEHLLDPANTNYRFQLRENATGELVASNTEGAEMDDTISGVNLWLFSISSGYELHDEDYVEWATVWQPYDSADWKGESSDVTDSGEYVEICTLYVWTGEEYRAFKDSDSHGYNEYGWYHYTGERGWSGYNSERDSRVTSTEYALTSGALAALPVDDDFRAGQATYGQWEVNIPRIGAAALACCIVFLCTLSYLCCVAGRRSGTDEVVLTWADRVPLDLTGIAVFLISILGISMGDSITYALNREITFARVVGLYVLTAILAAIWLWFLLSVAVRLKAGKFRDSFLCWRVFLWTWRTLGKMFRAIGRGVSDMVQTVSMNVRLALAFAAYLLVNGFLAAGFYLTYSFWFYLFGLVAFNGCVFVLACRWVKQWRAIRAGTGRIVGGDPTVQIDTYRMYPDLKEHAGQLNDLGTAINHAVDERMKSERFKAELITNVSHDLKTPLTSIINYVDLLKKLDIDDPTAQEYLEVLDRKGQRLKKLTEDLVEASKASTGNVTVNADRMDLVQFTQQAVAEYEDRLNQKQLTVISKMPEQPLYISADGRHMWRILDNLLGNCVKYAMEGTRVYLEVVEWDGKASISLKNISRDALNVSPEELTERFVRGDESRTTEGSGLGLSIARSLTEVQGGTFRLTTDGDLFKVTVYFPVPSLPAEDA